MDDLIISFAPTGMVPTQEITPYVPVSVSEIVEDVHRACEIGITKVHLHARDEISGEPTYKAEVYGDIIGRIRAFAPELIICVSLSGREFKGFEQRSEPLGLEGMLKPDMGSLTLSSMNFSNTASINAPDMVQKLAGEMKSRGILPELEVFDLGMVNYAKYLATKGFLVPPYYFNIIFGNVSGVQADLLSAGTVISALPEQSFWSFGGIGNAQLTMTAVSIAMGGSVRVGLEDNIWYDAARTRLATNSDLLQRIHRIAVDQGRGLMPSTELRKKLNLEAGNGKYGLRTE